MLDAITATTVISGRDLNIDGFLSGIIFPIISIPNMSSYGLRVYSFKCLHNISLACASAIVAILVAELSIPIFSAGTAVLDLQRILMNLFSHHHLHETIHIQRLSQAALDKSFHREGRHRCYPQTPS